jgi:hypothetical protein
MGGRRVGGDLNGILGEKDEVPSADVVGLEGKAIEKHKASLSLVRLHCESFEAKSMLASMLFLLDVEFFLLLTPPSPEVSECALVLRRCPTGVLSPVSFRIEILEMVNGGETELVWLVWL